MHQFKLVMGDWSDDGHGKTEDFIIESSHPVEEVREAYFRAVESSGFNIQKIAADYDSAIEEDQIDKLIELGVPPEILVKDPDGYTDFHHEEFAQLFCWFIMKFGLTLDLRLSVQKKEDRLPMFHFYGFDKQKRHIGFFGYGMFAP